MEQPNFTPESDKKIYDLEKILDKQVIEDNDGNTWQKTSDSWNSGFPWRKLNDPNSNLNAGDELIALPVTIIQ